MDNEPLPDYLEKLLHSTHSEKQQAKFLHSMAEDYGMHISNPPLPIEVVVIWAIRLKEGWRNADENPGGQHAGDEIDYAHDELERAVKEWLKL